MKTNELIEFRLTRDEPPTPTARRSPEYIENHLSGCTLPELLQRSKAVTEVLKRFLEFTVPLPKNTR